MTRGRFITLEGTEGVGKSTHLDRVRTLLESHGLQVVTTREPGGTPRAERLRELVLQPQSASPDTESIAPPAELLLIFAARALHLDNLIRPALERGRWVLCDRFTDASYAYQGGGRGVDRGHIRALEEWIVGPTRPDLTLLLDAPLEVAAARAGRRNRNEGGADRFEGEAGDFFRRVREAYLDIAAAEPGRVRVIDATGSIEQVGGLIEVAVSEYLSTAS